MDGYVTIKTELDTKSFEAQIEKLEDDLERLEAEYKIASKDQDFPEEELIKYRTEIEKTKNKLTELYQKQMQLNEKNNFDGLKSSMDNIITKVAKWGLAIFGIRSAYNFVRNSVSTLSQYNKNLAKDIENIRFGLASALQPVIQKIVTWAYKLMQAINYIWKIMTGKNLFSNVKKDLQASNSSAKQLQKTMASFDEMNTINDNSSGGGAGIGNAGDITEDLTATNLLSEQTKKKLEEIAGVLKTIWKDVLEPLWKKVLKPIGNWLLKHPDIIIGAIGTILGFKIGSKIVELTGLIGTAGTGGLIGALVLLDGVLIGKIVKDIKDELIPTIEDTKKRIDDAIQMQEGVKKTTDDLTKSILENAKSEDENTDATKRNINYLFKAIDQNQQLNKDLEEHLGIKERLTGEYKLNTASIKENNYESYQYFKTLGQLYELGKLQPEEVRKYRTELEKHIVKLEEDNKSLNRNSEEYKTNKKRIEELKIQLDKTKGTYNVDVKTKADKKPVDDLTTAVNKVEGTHTVKIKGDTTDANKSIGKWIKGLGSTLFKVLFPGLSFSTTLAKFKLAKGGIINMPGRGVPVAYGGEKGQEGVIPLTDSQQMALLGEAIGRYITINATITNTMNGRVISRELQKINNENNFANNK